MSSISWMVAQLQAGKARKSKRGRPSKASLGLAPDDRPGWMFMRACFVREVVERERTINHRTQREAANIACRQWREMFPMGRLSPTEVFKILGECQRKDRDVALRVVRDGDQWAFRFGSRPEYQKQGSGPKPALRFSKRYQDK